MHEEVDWCTRARQAGYRVVTVSDAVVRHRRGPGLARRRLEPHVYYFYGRNAMLYAHKHANIWQWVKLLTLSVVWIPGTFIKRILLGEPPRWVMKTVRLITLGMVDGWKRRDPPYERLGLRPAAAA